MISNLRYILVCVGMVFSILAHAIRVKQDFDIYAGADIVSAYMYRGTRVADEGVQPYVRLEYGNSRYGRVGGMGWLAFHYNSQHIEPSKMFYGEFDATLYYVFPYDFAKFFVQYFCYYDAAGYDRSDCNIGLTFGGYAKMPVLFRSELKAAGKDKGNYFLSCSYIGRYKRWEFIPQVGYNSYILDNEKSDYVLTEFDAKRYFNIAAGRLYIQGGVSCIILTTNKKTDFGYRDNVNCYIRIGFVF